VSLAAALSTLIAIGPAAALDVGVDVQAGGVSIGGNVGVGRTGTSLGTNTSVGDLGKVDAEASVGTEKGHVSTTVGAGGRLGGVGIGVGGRLDGSGGSLSAGTGSASPATGGVSSATGGVSSAAGTTVGGAGNAPGRSASASNAKGTGGVATSVSIAPVKGVGQTFVLPWVLRPSRGNDRLPTAAIEAVPGTPSAVVSACRAAIESAATPFGVVSVRAKSAGTLRRLSRGAVSAPIQVRIQYARQSGGEIRQARIKCQLDANGRVIELI
jgi:hypothetical protein